MENMSTICGVVCSSIAWDVSRKLLGFTLRTQLSVPAGWRNIEPVTKPYNLKTKGMAGNAHTLAKDTLPSCRRNC